MSARMLAAGLAGACVILAATAGGYLVGESAAVSESQATSAYEQAALRAQTAAEKRAFASSDERGQEKGLAQGRGAGEVAGTSAGRGAGQTSADEELAAIEAEAAAQAEAAAAAAADAEQSALEAEAERAEAVVGLDRFGVGCYVASNDIVQCGE